MTEPTPRFHASQHSTLAEQVFKEIERQILAGELPAGAKLGEAALASSLGVSRGPVREAISHGETGLLVDFFSPEALADQVADVLANPAGYAHIGPNARAHVVEKYDFLTRCLPEHIAQINALVPEARRIRI